MTIEIQGRVRQSSGAEVTADNSSGYYDTRDRSAILFDELAFRDDSEVKAFIGRFETSAPDGRDMVIVQFDRPGPGGEVRVGVVYADELLGIDDIRTGGRLQILGEPAQVLRVREDWDRTLVGWGATIAAGALSLGLGGLVAEAVRLDSRPSGFVEGLRRDTASAGVRLRR